MKCMFKKGLTWVAAPVDTWDDRRSLACIWPDDVHEYLSQRWSPLSLTLIYDTVAQVESWLIMCAALLIYSSKLKALVQGFLSYFQKLKKEFPLLFCATRVSLPCCCHSGQHYCRWICWPPFCGLLKKYLPSADRDCKHLGSIMILFFHLLFSDIHHHHVNLSWSTTFAKSTQRATHESWITITLANAVTSISFCILAGDPHSC